MGSPFSSKKIKYLSKKWKQNNYWNVAKLVGIFGKNNEGFMDFTKWKHDNICKVLYSTIKSRMNDLITKINASKWCKAFRVIN